MTTSTASPTPPGEDASAAGTTPAWNHDEAISTEHLLDAVLSYDNLARAWQRVTAFWCHPRVFHLVPQSLYFIQFGAVSFLR